MAKYSKASQRYFSKHVDFSGIVHICVGIGIGALITYPIAGSHPVRFSVTFLIIGILGYIWAAVH